MFRAHNTEDLKVGDEIFVVEHENGNTNTFNGLVTSVSYDEITLNNAFSFTHIRHDSQWVLVVENSPYYNAKHRVN